MKAIVELPLTAPAGCDPQERPAGGDPEESIRLDSLGLLRSASPQGAVSYTSLSPPHGRPTGPRALAWAQRERSGSGYVEPNTDGSGERLSSGRVRCSIPAAVARRVSLWLVLPEAASRAVSAVG